MNDARSAIIGATRTPLPLAHVRRAAVVAVGSVVAGCGASEVPPDATIQPRQSALLVVEERARGCFAIEWRADGEELLSGCIPEERSRRPVEVVLFVDDERATGVLVVANEGTTILGVADDSARLDVVDEGVAFVEVRPQVPLPELLAVAADGTAVRCTTELFARCWADG